MVAKGRPYEVDPAICMDDYDTSLSELVLFKSVGGSAIVDCQPTGAGRMSAELARLSAESGVHIVASTGFHKPVFYPAGHWIFELDEDRAREIFLHELQVGMFLNTENGPPTDFHSSRAGVVKIVNDIAGYGAHFASLLAAAAAAQVTTGAPMVIHIDNGSDPLVIDNLLDNHGVIPSKRIYCHLDRAVSDVGVHIQLLKRGCYVEYDTICRPKYHNDDAEIGIIKRVLDAGYGDRILLGMDATNQRLKAYGATIGLDYIKETFIPKMKAAGISNLQTDDFMVANPMRAFAF